jgi:RNA polymerase sigma factor (sigma-70 family)
MTDHSEFESLFTVNLPFIQRAIAVAARGQGIRGDDAEEFASWAIERLIENDYAILRKWRRDSSLTTYLSPVIRNLGYEFRVKHWGRWRHSAKAIDLGPIALRLEKLIYRDNWTFLEAVAQLRQRGDIELTDRELAELFAKIPRRATPSRLSASEVDVESVADESDTDTTIVESEKDADRRRMKTLLLEGVSQLSDLAQIVIRLHFLQGRTIAAIARALAADQKPLYRVKDDALRSLRRYLEANGVTREQARELLGGALDQVPNDEESAIPLSDEGNIERSGEKRDVRPSKDRDGSKLGEKDGPSNEPNAEPGNQ